MPSTSKAQQRFMYAMLEQQEKTGHNKTGMSASKLKEFTHVKPGSPDKKKPKLGD